VRYLTAVKSQETLERRVSRFVARWERENPMKKGKARKAKRAKKASK
jgi:hypothetical protein